jgi:hypothetical protein
MVLHPAVGCLGIEEKSCDLAQLHNMENLLRLTLGSMEILKWKNSPTSTKLTLPVVPLLSIDGKRAWALLPV